MLVSRVAQRVSTVSRLFSTQVRPQSFWEHDAGESAFKEPEGKALRGTSNGSREKVDILVAGGGFQGLWFSYFLQKHLAQKNSAGGAPKSMLLVERDRLSFGASSRNAGFLTAGNITEILDDCNEIGEHNAFEIFWRRAEGIHLITSNFPQVLKDCTEFGSCDFDELTPEKRSLADRVNSFITDRSASSTSARFSAPFHIKEVPFCGKRQEVSINDFDKGIHPVRLLMTLRSHLQASSSLPSLNSSFAFGWNIESLSNGIAVLSRLSPSDPNSIERKEVEYGMAISCMNAFSRSALGKEEYPIVPGRGQVIVTSPIKINPNHTEPLIGYGNNGYDYWRWINYSCPPGTSRLLYGGGRNIFREKEETIDMDPPFSDPVRQYLQDFAANLIGHTNWKIDHHWAGIMGFPTNLNTCDALVASRSKSAKALAPSDCLDSHGYWIDPKTFGVFGHGGIGVAMTPYTGFHLSSLISNKLL